MSDKSKNQTQKSNALTRYRDLILSIAVFLLLIIALMAYSTWASRQLAQQSTQLSAMEQLHSQYQQSVQRIYGIGVGVLEGFDPKSPQMTHHFKELNEHMSRFQATHNALQKGAALVTEEGSQLDVQPLAERHLQEHLGSIDQAWQPIARQMSEYLKTADTLTSNDLVLRNTIAMTQDSHDAIHGQIDTVIDELTTSVQNGTRTLTIVQVGGIAAALVYFIIFIQFFLRKLRQADETAELARNETTEILNTVTSGLFLLDRDLQIGNQYSSELENLIGMREIANRNLLDILSTKLPEHEVENTAEFVGQLYNAHVKERLIGSLNPLIRIPMRIANLKTGEERSRYLSFRFNRVYHGKDITRVLVSVTDETDAVLLEQKIEQEREQSDVQLEMLSTLLSADQKMVNDFIKSTKRRNLEINNILKQPGEKQADFRNKAIAIFREVHSLKGEASTFKLEGFTVLAESLENELKSLQNIPSLSGEDFLGLTVSLDKLMQLTQTIEGLARRIGGGSESFTNQSVTDGLRQKDRFDEAGVQQAYYTRFVSELAARNGKKVVLACSGLETELDEKTDELVKEVVIQLLRNAVVHGIETPTERLAKQKQATGSIQLVLNETDNSYTLFLRDDGAGIQVERIRQKAIEEGICSAEQAATLSEQQLYGLLFRSGFSTANEVTGDAGRGVGLDIIKERITQMGGKINVSSTPNSFTRFAFTFPKK